MRGYKENKFYQSIPDYRTVLPVDLRLALSGISLSLSPFIRLSESIKGGNQNTSLYFVVRSVGAEEVHFFCYFWGDGTDRRTAAVCSFRKVDVGLVLGLGFGVFLLFILDRRRGYSYILLPCFQYIPFFG